MPKHTPEENRAETDRTSRQSRPGAGPLLSTPRILMAARLKERIRKSEFTANTRSALPSRTESAASESLRVISGVMVWLSCDARLVPTTTDRLNFDRLNSGARFEITLYEHLESLIQRRVQGSGGVIIARPPTENCVP